MCIRDSAVGGGLRYESAAFHGFSMGVSGFYIFDAGSSDLAKKDAASGQANRYEIGLFDVTDPENLNEINRVEEFFIKYRKAATRITFGRQLINTPFINLQDGRMRPTAVEGVWLETSVGMKHQFQGGWLYGIAPRGTSKWYSTAAVSYTHLDVYKRQPLNGKTIYIAKCASCHQVNGEGILTASGEEYTYPPLWGKNSYNDAAGLYRLSNFAKYAKYNMPLGATHEMPQLSDEEAWDLSAFVNTQPRPHKETPADWPDISKKPIDHPSGPYSDEFNEKQHKFGPFKPIAEARKTSK